jgi:hypothetical protein
MGPGDGKKLGFDSAPAAVPISAGPIGEGEEAE